jgi:hypothetical protein
LAFLLSKAWLKRKQARLLQVASLYGAISDVNNKVGQVSNLPFQTYYGQALEVARSGLAEGNFGEAFTLGQVMTLEGATSYARQALSSL